MKTDRTIKLNGKVCKVLSMERMNYIEPVDRESGPAGQRTKMQYSCTIRRHIVRVQCPDKSIKQITIDPLIPDRPDDFEPLRIEALPPDPGLPKGLSRIYCEGRTFCATVRINDVEPEKKTTAEIKRARKNRVNGKEGGRETKDPQEKIDAAVQGVRLRLKNNPAIGMKRACEYECNAQKLSIKWQALRNHVKNDKGGRVIK